MGRKKAKRVKPNKKTFANMNKNLFPCPKCRHENVVKCKMSRATNTATAACSVCDATFHCSVKDIEQPLDVYFKWSDQC